MFINLKINWIDYVIQIGTQVRFTFDILIVTTTCGYIRIPTIVSKNCLIVWKKIIFALPIALKTNALSFQEDAIRLQLRPVLDVKQLTEATAS